MNYYNYFSEIEELFIRRRGRSLLLSPLDWALIETWQERNVPLHIILRGIERVFDSVDKQPARKRTVKSLMYCREEVEAQYAEWLESQIGKEEAKKPGDTELKSQKTGTSEDFESNGSKHDLFPDETIAAHLENVFVALKAAKNKAGNGLRETLENVLNRLSELRQQTLATGKLEESLEELDALIDEKLLQNCETDGLKTEIEKQMASHKINMEAEIYRRTFDLMLLKRLREQAEIPRLSLFYL